jgi:flagellin
MGVSSRTSKGARKFSPEPLSLPQSAFMPANFQTAEATAATPSPMQTIIDSADASISAAIEADDALGAQGQGINYLFRLASEVAFNPELSEEDRQILETEFADVRDSIDQVGRETEFEGRALLDGSAEQSGHPSTRLPTIDSTAQGLNIANLSLEDGDQAFAALGNLLDASERIFDARDSLAVSVGRLDAMRENLSVQMDFSTTAAMQTLSSGSPGTTGSLGAANDAAMAMNGLLINLIA